MLKSVGNVLRKGLIEEGHFLQRGLSRLEVLNGGDYRGGGLIRNSKFRRSLEEKGCILET